MPPGALLQTLPPHGPVGRSQGERGISIGHTAIRRWVQRYAPEMEKRLRWPWRQPRSTRWRVDETYVKVRGEWAYLCRAVNKHGNTIDLYLSPTRSTAAAKRFPGKALAGLKGGLPDVTNADKAPTHAAALAGLKQEGKCPKGTVHRQAKRLNSIVEADHGKLKQPIRPVRGCKTLGTACATSVARPASSSAPSGWVPARCPTLSSWSASGQPCVRRHRQIATGPAFAHPENIASQRVLTKAGFRAIRFIPRMNRLLFTRVPARNRGFRT